MKEDYLKNIINIEEKCQELRELAEARYYKKDGSLTTDGLDGFFCYFPIYHYYFDPIKNAVEICDFFGVKALEKKKPTLLRRIGFLADHNHVRNKNWFDESLKKVENVLKKSTGKLKKKISLLSSEEKDRLDEAIHCFLEGCYYSATAMSVSAIESRLFSLMMDANPNAKLEKLTLGLLITEYLENKGEYNNIIPEKHEYLLKLCNVYRVFSVHPKKEEIRKPVASSILNMTFLFLLDKKLAKQNKSKSTSKKG